MISADKIQEAWPAVRKVVHHTPIFHSHSLAERCGMDPAHLHLKMENFQRTGSFKIRGACHRLGTFSEEEKRTGVVAASAGNHAQGIALAARLAGIHATVFMPEFASIAKIQATRQYGAEVILQGSNFDEAVSAAKAFAGEHGGVFVSAFDDDGIITGQGTLGLEILDDVPDVANVLICVGGGGLFSGVATALKAARPHVRLIGVQAAGAPNAVNSWRAGRLLPHQQVQTIADGIAIKSPSERTFEYIQKYADAMITVDDQEITRAILLLLERAKTVVEPAGGLVALLEAVAELKGNVISVVHNRISPSVPLGYTGVELLLEVRDAEHIASLKTGLNANGYRVEMLD